ncbi:MAG: hypothetical protein ACTSUO_10120, partial [Candidatus Thorarchaeota archaeon]
MSWGWIALGVVVVSTSASMYSTHQSAKSQSKAIRQQAELQANERAKKTRKLASQQKASFLSSGIALMGEGTSQSVFDDTYDTGIEDMNRIKQNAVSQQKNVWSKARSSMIKDLGMAAVSLATMGVGSALSAGAKTAQVATAG